MTPCGICAGAGVTWKYFTFFMGITIRSPPTSSVFLVADINCAPPTALHTTRVASGQMAGPLRLTRMLYRFRQAGEAAALPRAGSPQLPGIGARGLW